MVVFVLLPSVAMAVIFTVPFFRPVTQPSASTRAILALELRYTYTAEDVGMTGESFSLKKGKTFYYLHAYYRTELAEESAAVIGEMLGSSEWI